MALITTPASLWVRLAALVYDSLLIFGIWVLATFAVLPFTGGQAVTLGMPWYRIYLFLITAAFFVGFWCTAGQTLGMTAWRLRVRTVDGDRISLSQGVVRLVIAWVTLGGGLLYCLFDPERRALHDVAAGTVLVREPRGQ